MPQYETPVQRVIDEAEGSHVTALADAQTKKTKPASRAMRRQARSDACREPRGESRGSDFKPDDAYTRPPFIEAIVRSLRSRLGEIVDRTVIEAAVTAELDRYSDAPIKQFIPILVERRVFDQLGR